MLQFLKSLPLLLLAQSLIMTGVFFISGRLLPALLGPVYAAVPTPAARTVLASLLLIPVGNFLCGWCLSKFDPAISGPTMIATSVLVQVLFTVAVMQDKPPLLIWPATMIVMAGSVWVSILLQK